MHPIIEKLDNLGWKAEQQIEDLNSGGCCVYAALVGRRLSELGVPVRGIVAMSDWQEPGNLDEARQNVNDPGDGMEWYDNDVTFTHVGLQFDLDGETYQYDSGGVTKPKRYLRNSHWNLCEGHLTVEEMEQLAERPGNWSSWFNREQIPALERLVKEYL